MQNRAALLVKVRHEICPGRELSATMPAMREASNRVMHVIAVTMNHLLRGAARMVTWVEPRFKQFGVAVRGGVL